VVRETGFFDEIRFSFRGVLKRAVEVYCPEADEEK
jgi:hypothetical protein